MENVKEITMRDETSFKEEIVEETSELRRVDMAGELEKVYR